MTTDTALQDAMLEDGIVMPSKNWYKYQYYDPANKESDSFGFVHFERQKDLTAYAQSRQKKINKKV